MMVQSCLSGAAVVASDQLSEMSSQNAANHAVPLVCLCFVDASRVIELDTPSKLNRKCHAAEEGYLCSGREHLRKHSASSVVATRSSASTTTVRSAKSRSSSTNSHN
jgi:hypothetical protein